MQILFYQKRDKSFVEIISTANSNSNYPESKIIFSIDELAENISFEKKLELEELFEKRKMNWEMFVGNFSNFNDFKNKMLKQGVKSVPSNNIPKFVNEKEFFSFNKQFKKTMLQRKQY